MKNLMIPIVIFFSIAIIYTSNVTAQSCCDKGKSSCNKTSQSAAIKGTAKDSMKVLGKCGMCKARIEKAAKSVKGITDAQWNAATNKLIYSYNGIVKKADVSDAILAVGHDTEMGKAQDKVYNKLPACCKYR
jgi:copper chaperone CopZ